MKTIKIVTLILFFPILFFVEANGQSRGLAYKQASSIDLIIGGGLSFSLIGGDPSDSRITEDFANRGEYERFKLSQRIGFNFYRGLNGSLSFKTGLRISNPGFVFSSIIPIDVNEDINKIDKEYIKTGGSTYKYNYQIWELPIGLKHVFARSWCASFLEFGIAPSLYWKTNIKETTYEGQVTRISKDEKLNFFNFIGFLGLGGDFEISENLSGFSQITGRFQINNLRSGRFNERLVGIGMEIGIKRML